MLSFNKPAAIIAHCFSWQVNVGGTLPAADNLECRVSCWPNGAPGAWDKDEVWWGRVRACQSGAEAFQQQRQKQRQLHTEAGLLTLRQTCWNAAFPWETMFSSSDLEWKQPVPSSPNSSCRFGISLSALPLIFSFMMLHPCLLTRCSTLRDTQCFTCLETSQPDKNGEIKAEHGVSVYTTTTSHTWWLCKTTLFQSRLGFLSWNCTLHL